MHMIHSIRKSTYVRTRDDDLKVLALVGLFSVSTVRYTYKSACMNKVFIDLTDDNELSANKWIRIKRRFKTLISQSHEFHKKK